MKQLIAALHKIGSVKQGHFTLKSGQTSSVYIDIRQIISYPDILRAVADMMWEKARSCQFDRLCGVPYTALPIATCMSLQNNIPMLMCRKENKQHGTKQKIEGAFSAGQRCLLIEDVITTGSSVMEVAADIESAGLVITDIVVLIDREQGGIENLRQKNYNVHTVLTMTDILAGTPE